MVRKKSACGLCKPHKKWKQTDTKAKRELRREIQEEIIEVSVRSPLSSNQISPRTNQRSLFAQQHHNQDVPYA